MTLRIFILLLLTSYIHQSFAQVTLTDDLQRKVTLHSPAQRIVSLAPSITETLFAIGAGDRVVGVTDYCNYPAEAATRQRVGGIVNPSHETILSLKPDLILLSMEGNVREDFNKLVSFGVPVFVTNPRDLDGIYRSIAQLGTLTGEQAKAMHLVQSLRTRADSIVHTSSLSPARKVLLFVSLQPIIVVGKNTFLAELIDLAGGTNPAANAAMTYPTYSREAVLKDNPDVLIFMSDVVSDPADLLHVYSEWSTLKAFRHKNVYSIESDIVSRPGPRAIDGLEALHKLLHQQNK